MSAAVQIAAIPAPSKHAPDWKPACDERRQVAGGPTPSAEEHVDAAPSSSMAFYRKHTEKLLRRYLYSSMLIGRAPNIVSKNLNRGWASYRRIETFEDSVIFVLDMERCLDKLEVLDRQLIGRIVLQEYSHSEAAMLLGVGTRLACTRFAVGMDRLTEILLGCGMLDLPYKR